MDQDNRQIDRKEFSGEINFESMLTGGGSRGVVCRNGSCVDISNGGLGLIAPYKATAGEILKLLVPLKGLEITVPVFAEVLWVQPFEDHYKSGLRFLA